MSYFFHFFTVDRSLRSTNYALTQVPSLESELLFFFVCTVGCIDRATTINYSTNTQASLKHGGRRRNWKKNDLEK